jgi:hypothetical protein
MVSYSVRLTRKYEPPSRQYFPPEKRRKKKMTKKVKIVTATLIGLLAASFMVAAIPITTAADGWTLVYDGRGVKAYPDLREYVWQKVPTASPHGVYDKIGLHRLVKTGITPKGVVFMNHWAGNSVEQILSNPPTDNYTKYENISQAIYWANRGFDVYTIDYRTGFVPPLNTSELSFMTDWGLDVWISDLREAVLKTKEISGAQKVFMTDVGISYGAMNYAAKYWKEDLRGIILLGIEFPSLGASPIGAKCGIQTNTYNATKAINEMNSNGNWSAANAGLDIMLYAAANPGAPSINPWTGQPLTPAINPLTGKPFVNISENMAFKLSAFANFNGGYADVVTALQYYGSEEYYPSPWKWRIERQAMIDWVNCTYLTYDYDDHWNEIGVPMLVFATGLYDNRTGNLNLANDISNHDFTGIYLPNYSWLDVYVGTYSARDVSQPALQWMLGQLAGLKATAFCDVTVLPGWTWNFFAHSSGGTGSHTYQWYEGSTLLQGQTSMVLPVTKTSRGTYTYYCKVTDSQGAAAYSNTVILTVRG